MTAHVIAPNPVGPFDAGLRILLAVYDLLVTHLEALLVEVLDRNEDLRDALAGARRSVEDEQDAHAATRLLTPRLSRTDLHAKVAAAVHAGADGRATPRQVTG